MSSSQQTFRIQVLGGGDPLRIERLTRSLRDAVAELDGVSVDFASDERPAMERVKGIDIIDPSLWAVVTYSSTSLGMLLNTAIKEWCAKERNRKVRISQGDRSVEIQGNPSRSQERLVSEFFDRAGDNE